MPDEKKIMRGGATSEPEAIALNEDALEGVAGGTKSRSSKALAEKAWDWVKGKYTDGEDAEQP